MAKHFGGSDKITANDVILTHGANMGLFTALMSITNPGDNILVPEIGYPFFNKTGPVTNYPFILQFSIDYLKESKIYLVLFKFVVLTNNNFISSSLSLIFLTNCFLTYTECGSRSKII